MARDPVVVATPAAPGWRHDVGLFLHYLGFAFPFLMILLGPLSLSLRTVVFNGVVLDWWFVAAILIAVAWVILDFINLTRALLSGPRLIENALVSVIVGYVMLSIAHWMWDAGTLPWAVLIPAAAAIIDSLLSVYLAVNQALLKRVLQEERLIA